MHLIESLAAGIQGAENGTVSFVLRGTATPSTYYTDFEATQQYSGTQVALDSNGSLVAYVAALVDVFVYSSLGVLVREFVAGVEDAVVEVISPSFTGVDYTSGASGVQKPTSLGAVLDSWVTSAGAPDWNVLVNGVPTALQSLANTSYLNVKSYGAQGNGTSDDLAAITAASAAATALGGGIIYFPPGVYRITAPATLPANVTWLGCGGYSTKLAIGNAVATNAVSLPICAAGAMSAIVGMWIGAINNTSSVLIQPVASCTGEFHFTDCILGSDSLTNGNIFSNLASVTGFKAVFTRCYLRLNAGAVPLIQQAGFGRLILRDSDFVSSQAVGLEIVKCTDGCLIEGCRFDASAATFGVVVYVVCAPGIAGAYSVQIIGNRFASNSTLGAAGCYAIHNTGATPSGDAMEWGNTFGDTGSGPTNITPYLYNTDGYFSFGTTFYVNAHGSREGRKEVIPSNTTTATVNPKAYGVSIVRQLVAGPLTINANKGSLGERWVLQIVNNFGGALVVNPGTNIIFDPTVTAGALNLALNGFSFLNFTFLPDNSAVGRWYLTGKAVTT